MQFGPQLVTKYENWSELNIRREPAALATMGITWLRMLISHHFVLKWKPNNQISLVKFLCLQRSSQNDSIFSYLSILVEVVFCLSN